MPTYDYVCDQCEHAFEAFQRIDEDVLTDCPECGKSALRRLFGAGSGLLFKGSGFYETDYRSDNYKKRQKEDKPESKTKSKTKSEASKSPKKDSGKSSS
ncbi:MAG: FmdB family zinc ribbon protein [Planctomycetota bacterium]